MGSIEGDHRFGFSVKGPPLGIRARDVSNQSPVRTERGIEDQWNTRRASMPVGDLMIIAKLFSRMNGWSFA
jgi:hypothetical protein